MQNANPHARALALTSAAWHAGGPRERDALCAVAPLLGQALSGGCVIRLVNRKMKLVPLAVAHDDTEACTWLEDLLRTDPTGFVDAFSARVVQSGKPVVITTSLSRCLMRLWTAPAYWPFLEDHVPSALLTVPLSSAKRVRGTLSVWRDQPGAPFNDDELVFVEAVARRLQLIAQPIHPAPLRSGPEPRTNATAAAGGDAC